MTDDSTAWLQATLAALSDAVLAVDADGAVCFMNPAAEALTGCKSAAAMGRQVQEVAPLTHETTGAALPHPLKFALEKNFPARVPDAACLRHSGGKQRSVEGMAVPVPLPSGNLAGAALVFRDRSLMRLTEQQLREVQHGAVLGRLSSGIAHDFNNLITIIMGSGEIALGMLKAAPNAQLDAPLQEIRKATEKAALLTQQILTLGRKHQLQPAVVDLNALLGSMEKPLARVLGERIRVVARFDPQLPVVEMDPTRVQEVVLHLAVNAWEAMPTGGELHIETRRGPRMPDGAQAAEVVIRDTGVGMDAATLQRAFEPCFSTKDGAKGMGLPLVRDLLRPCHGSIQIESAPGRGTTVLLSFAAVHALPEKAPEISRAAPNDGSVETVLLVEDADRVRRLFARVLADGGYRVLEASNGREALSICRENEGRIDLVVTDVIMPEMSGPELIRSLQANAVSPRVLFLSGYTADELGREGLDKEVCDFLQKPFLGDVLVRKVREVLARDDKVTR